MTAAWIVQWANGEPEAFGDERAVESRARELEPDVRVGYWDRRRGAVA